MCVRDVKKAISAATRQRVYRERNLGLVRKRDRDRKKKARAKKAKTQTSKAFPASPSKAIAKWARENWWSPQVIHSKESH